MALSPWHVASRLSFDDVAALLADFDIPQAKTGNVYDHQIKEYEEWCLVIIRAAKDGEIKPWRVEIYTEDVVPDPELEGNLVTGMDWVTCRDESWRWRPDNHIRMTLERPEVYRWLKASGIADDDIPEALRVMPKPKPQAPATPQDKPLHHKRRQTYLKLIEGLALEALGGEIPDEPYKAAGILQAVLERHGLKLDDEPIAKTVQKILAAREERASDPF